jgi:hypothetical protein
MLLPFAEAGGGRREREGGPPLPEKFILCLEWFEAYSSNEIYAWSVRTPTGMNNKMYVRAKTKHVLPTRPVNGRFIQYNVQYMCSSAAWSNLESTLTATISGDKAYLIMIANQSKRESCVVTSTCHMFILNKVTLLYDSLMILEGYWRAFISLAASARDWLSSLHGVVHAACIFSWYVCITMHGAHLLINQTCTGRVVADFGIIRQTKVTDGQNIRPPMILLQFRTNHHRTQL